MEAKDPAAHLLRIIDFSGNGVEGQANLVSETILSLRPWLRCYDGSRRPCIMAHISEGIQPSCKCN